MNEDRHSVFNDLAKLIDSMTESLVKNQDRLEVNQAQLSLKIEKLQKEVYDIATEEAIGEERVRAITQQLEHVVERITNTADASGELIRSLDARIDTIEKWIDIEKSRKATEEKQEEKAFRKKVTGTLSRIAQLLAAGAAGGGIAKLLVSLLGG